MHIYSHIIKIIGVTCGLLMVAPVFAESAPVYDADNMPQQSQPSMDPSQPSQTSMGQSGMDPGPIIDDATDQSQYLPPPPSPDQEMSGAFAPPPPTQQQPSPVAVKHAPPPTMAISTDLDQRMSIDQRMHKVEQQINNMQNSDATSRVESLQSQVQALRGQVEELTHQLQQLQNQQKSTYTDLDKRLSQLRDTVAKQTTSLATVMQAHEETADVNATSVEDDRSLVTKSSRRTASKAGKKSLPPSGADFLPKSQVSQQPNVAEEQQIYQTAYNLIKDKKYSEAVSALQGMLKKYPSGQFASNAHYWLGELYGLMGKNDLALSEFNVVVKNYPDSSRVSDAQLKVGLILASQLKWPDAKAALKKVIHHYPGTASARLASEQLKHIRQAGH